MTDAVGLRLLGPAVGSDSSDVEDRPVCLFETNVSPAIIQELCLVLLQDLR